MMRIRRSEERGHADHGWLVSAHTFSFAGYHDPEHMGFRSLRVINEDRVDANKGFPTHGHRDMEIISYVLDGALEHEDSTGESQVLRPGEVQRMSAGTGVYHSEYNASASEPVHFLQIWIVPDRRGLAPEYEQKLFPDEEKKNALRLLVSPDGENGSIRIHQDARIYGSLLDPDVSIEHGLGKDRHVWVQLARGSIELEGQRLEAGDGASISDVAKISMRGIDRAELLLFDLA
jgi:quercetin 2,3-dioxygenase